MATRPTKHVDMQAAVQMQSRMSRAHTGFYDRENEIVFWTEQGYDLQEVTETLIEGEQELARTYGNA